MIQNMEKQCINRIIVAACIVNGLFCIISSIYYLTPLSRQRTSSLQEQSKLNTRDTLRNYESPLFLSGTSETRSRILKNIAPITKGKENKNYTHSRQKLGDQYQNETKQLFPFHPSFSFHKQRHNLPSRNVEELFHRVVPNNVYYVWCGKARVFEFNHFLSVYNVWHQMEPDIIEIHYESLPMEDKYNSWLSWLRSSISSLSLRPLPGYVTGDRCEQLFGLEIVADRGGMFISNGVILLPNNPNSHSVDSVLNKHQSFSFTLDGKLAWASAACCGNAIIKGYLSLSDQLRKSQTFFNFLQLNIHKMLPLHEDGKSNEVNLYSCKDKVIVTRRRNAEKGVNNEKDYVSKHDQNHTASNQNYYNANLQDKETTCYVFIETIYPENLIKTKNDPVLQKLGCILYNHEKGFCKKNGGKNYEDVRIEEEIPNIVNYIWFGLYEMTFSMYLSFLSCVHIVQPKWILIHSDLKLYGKYWDKVMHHSKVRIVYREMPWFVYQHRIVMTQHRSDIVRADVLDKYGGIYLDWDVLWLKSPNPLIKELTDKAHDIVLSRDHMPRRPFPETINMGVVLSKPRSKFMQALRSDWMNYRSFDFLYNAVELPYKIYELFPSTTLLHDRLQVMCYFLHCHPLFHPQHKQWGRDQPFDWHTDVYSIHFTHPDPPVYNNETALFQGHGMFADIGRFIFNLSQH